MKKVVSFMLILMLVFSFAGSAMAIRGVADASTYVRLRKTPTLDSTVRAYIKAGTPVDIFDNTTRYGDGDEKFYRVGASSYTDRHNWTGEAYRSGYASTRYISY